MYYVTIATPTNGNQPFIFGVFTTEDIADAYIKQYGETDVIYRTSHEPLLSKMPFGHA